MSPFSVDNFRANFTDLSRQYMFKVKFASFLVGFDETTTILVESTSLPTKNVTPVDAQFMGQQFKLAGNIEYPDWTVTFRMDTGLKVYSSFRLWIDGIRPGAGPEPNTMAAPSVYKGIIILNQLNGNQDVVGTLKLHGVFPSALGEVTLDTKSSEIQLFPITFTYDYHEYTWGQAD